MKTKRLSNMHALLHMHLGQFLRTHHLQRIRTRSFSTSFAPGADTNSDTLRNQCLAVLRTIAQPVSVITTLDWEREQSSSLDSTHTSKSLSVDESHPKLNSPTGKFWHGATLSSFTSIAMYPYPLISFALRTPAKMADLLRPLTMNTEIDSYPDSNNPMPKIHLAINLLAAHQSHLAIHFSRPRALSAPAENSGASSMSMQPPLSTNLRYTHTSEGIPILYDTLGALGCTLITSIPLDTIHSESSPPSRSNNISPTSELFIARIMCVLPSLRSSGELSEEDLSPLVYHKQQYRTIK